MKIHHFLLILLSVFALSCKKDKNKSSIDLSAIYFAGNEVDGGPVKPVYWNNNTKTTLPLGGPAFNGNANSIRIAGTDVYVAGEESEPGKTQAILWKNGVRTALPSVETNSWAYSVFINGGDVYVAGKEQNPTTSKEYPILWKNGVRTQLLAPDDATGIARSVFVNGTDVYVAGEIINNTGNSFPAYWKNGNLVQLSTTTGGITTAVFIDGTDIYLAGADIVSGNKLPVYWKNGVKTTLRTSTALPYGQGNDINVKNGTVYVAGVEYPASPGKSNGVLWINGTSTTFSIPTQTIIAANAIHLAGNEPVAAGNQNGLATYWVNSNGCFLSNNVSRVNAVTGK